VNVLRGKCRLRVFENRVLRIMFSPERDRVTREWRKLQNKQLNDQYSLPNIFRVIKSRRMGCVGHVSHTRMRRGVYMFMVGDPEGKRPFGISRRRWEENIKMHSKEVGCEGVDWI
jgi:hypothetical protein